MTDNLSVVGTQLLPGVETALVPLFPMSCELLLNTETGLFLALLLNKLENCPKFIFHAEFRAVNVRSLCQIQCLIPILQMLGKHHLDMVHRQIPLKLVLPVCFLPLSIDRHR